MNFDLSNPTTQAMIGGVIRAGLIALGGFGMTGDQTSQVAGALAVLIGVGWSLWQKKSAATAAHQTVVTAVTATARNPQAAPAVIAAAKATPQNVGAILSAARGSNF